MSLNGYKLSKVQN